MKKIKIIKRKRRIKKLEKKAKKLFFDKIEWVRVIGSLPENEQREYYKLVRNLGLEKPKQCPKCSSYDTDEGKTSNGKKFFYCYNCHYEKGF